MDRVKGKVAFISGIARGQGRSHALALAKEGADIIGFDLCDDIEHVGYPLARESDLAETIRLVEEAGGRIVAARADSRDFDAVDEVLRQGLDKFGRVDIAVPNAGVVSYSPIWEWSAEQFRNVLDTNLVGVWHVVKAVMPHIIAAGNGGSLIFTGSVASLKGCPNIGAYEISKHGVVGLMRLVAMEGAPHNIRSNIICPTNVRTGMIDNAQTIGLFVPDNPNATLDDAAPAFATMNMLPVPWISAQDISNGVVFLASDEARYITSVVLPIDAGSSDTISMGG